MDTHRNMAPKLAIALTAAALALVLAGGAALYRATAVPTGGVDLDDPRLVRAPKYTGLMKRTLDEMRERAGVPESERGMTLEEVVDALAAGNAWARFALELRADGMAPAELAHLAEYMASVAPAIKDPLHARRFVSGAADALPGPLMLPIADSVLFNGLQEDFKAMAMFVGVINRQQHPLPEAVPRLREIYWIARYDDAIAEYEVRHHASRIHHHIIGAMGKCGEAGIDPIIETGIRGRSAAYALGRIGTERALDTLMQWYQETELDSDKRNYLAALCVGRLSNRPERVQAFVKEHLTPFFTDPDEGARRRTAEIAGSAAYCGDLYFLPHLIAMRDNDPDERAREYAAQGVENLWRVFHRESETALAKARYKIESLRDKIAYFERQRSKPDATEEQKAREAEKIAQAEAELALLEVQLAALEDKKARFEAGELPPNE